MLSSVIGMVLLCAYVHMGMVLLLSYSVTEQKLLTKVGSLNSTDIWIMKTRAFPGIPSDPETRKMTENDNKSEIVQLPGKSDLLSS